MSIRTVTVSVGMSAMLGIAGLAHAGAPEGSWYVEPELLWVSPDSKFDAKDDFGYRVAVGKSLNQEWDAELAYAETSHDPKAGGAGKLKLGLTELDFKRIFHRDSRCNPFIVLGVGALNGSVDGIAGSSSTRLAAKLGLGALVGLGAANPSRAQFVMDVGLRADDVKGFNSGIDPYAAVGVRFNLGGAAPAPAALPPPPPVVAAPPPAPLPPPPPPAPPADSDHDGVIDSLDKCPTTPAGDKVDSVGCSLTMALQVNFDTNSAHIKADSIAELDRFVAFLKDVPSVSGELQGHTDSVGKDAYNLRLSQQRAEAVKAYAVEHGIDAARLTARGYGETQPVADNATAEGRAQNRRVLFVHVD